MKKYKIIDKYSNQQRNEFSDLSQAQEYLNKIQKIGKIGILKGKEVFKIKEVDLDKQRIQSALSRNRKAMKKEWFGI